MVNRFLTELTLVDLGCGSGLWAIEVANQYDKTYVCGLDISPVQPTLRPDNLDFIITDVTKPLNFDDGSVDLVQSRYPHSQVTDARLLLSGITRDQWPGYIDEIFRICKPGNGWAQIIEGSAYLKCDDNTVPMNADIYQVTLFSGEVLTIVSKMDTRTLRG